MLDALKKNAKEEDACATKTTSTKVLKGKALV